jgi:hypothetical protein
MFASLIYQGQPIPRPNQELKMYFTFENENQNEIFYFRTGEKGFCRRKASYSIEHNRLIQKVISVDGNNADFCSQDSDMQIGNESISIFEVKDDVLYLDLPLGEDTITYVWEKP